MVWPAEFLGPFPGYQPTLPAPPSRTLRVPAQLWALALASDLRSSLAMPFLDHGRLLAADDPSTSPYAANALLPMSVVILLSALERPRYPIGIVRLSQLRRGAQMPAQRLSMRRVREAA